MADSSTPKTDYKAHLKGYSKFINTFKWGAIATFILAAIIVYVIAS